MKPMKNDELERQLDATRIKIYERTKNMKPEERIAYFNNRAREIMDRHGLKANFVQAPVVRH